MRAAIYARYSSESQRQESIEDQIFTCRRLAREKGFTVLDDHIYTDYAQSGASKDRIGLNELIAASTGKPFDVVLVDDLSRLARDNFLMLSVLAEFQYVGVSVISVADNLDSSDEDSALGIQIRGIFNELQLRDLKKKTLRGLVGQKQRGFSAGERTFGYTSVPSGKTITDKKGRTRPEGYKHEIEEREASVVLRIFQAYVNGQSITGIVKLLNEEGVCGYQNVKKNWGTTTVGRILSNEKYIGKWVWNKSESRRDPKTGRRKQFPKPESEWIVTQDESLRIVPQELWDATQRKRQSVKKTWPSKKGERGFGKTQGSCQTHYPTHLLAGAMTCGSCGGNISQVSGKNGGYYGCANARKKSCDNKVLVRRSLVEKIVINEVRKQISSPEKIQYLLEKVEAEVSNLYSDIPDSIRHKESELRSEEKRLANYINFIGDGNASRMLNQALLESEQKVDALQSELDSLRQARDNIFQAPPIEWIEDRLSKFSNLLELNTSDSALALRELLGSIKLEAQHPDVGRPYYVAHSSINALTLTEPLPGEKNLDNGSNSFHWWARQDSNLRPMDYESTALTN